MYMKELTNEEFTTFADHFKEYSIYQTMEYAFVMNNQRFDSLFLGLFEESGKLVGASLLLIEQSFGFKYAYAPHGFLLDYENDKLVEEFTYRIKKFLGKNNIMGIKLNPRILKSIQVMNQVKKENDNYARPYQNLLKNGYFHLGYNNFFEALKPRFEAVIDIQKPYVQIFQNIHKKFRTKIRSAEKNGITVYKGKKEDLEHLYFHTKKKYKRNLKYFEDMYDFYNKRNMINFYYAKLDTKKYLLQIQTEYEALEQKSYEINQNILTNLTNNPKLISKKIIIDNELENKKKELIEATNTFRNNKEGIIMASLLVAKYRDTVYVLMDGYDPTHQKFNAKHLLLWKLIEKYNQKGYRKFNLGGISNPNEEDNKYNGLNEFKLHFGADTYEYTGDFELITNNAQYFVYRNSAPIRNILKR